MTLRTRLLLALLGLVALGLLVAGVATFTSLRSFLLTRVDQQLSEARYPVLGALASDRQLPGAGRTACQPSARHLRRTARLRGDRAQQGHVLLRSVGDVRAQAALVAPERR